MIIIARFRQNRERLLQDRRRLFRLPEIDEGLAKSYQAPGRIEVDVTLEASADINT